jgi:hypothetical protein
VPSVQSDIQHTVVTSRRRLNYTFTPKHHGASSQSACWLEDLTFDEEFAIFDRADGVVTSSITEDDRQVADAAGNLYGYERLEDGALRELGTWNQQLAEFPVQDNGATWHGYPIWPIAEIAPQNYQGERCRPAKEVFDRMLELGDINTAQCKRLKKGDFA